MHDGNQLVFAPRTGGAATPIGQTFDFTIDPTAPDEIHFIVNSYAMATGFDGRARTVGHFPLGANLVVGYAADLGELYLALWTRPWLLGCLPGRALRLRHDAVYVATADERVVRVTRSGGVATDVLAHQSSPSKHIAVDATTLYWTRPNALLAKPLDGAAARTLRTGIKANGFIALDDRFIYLLDATPTFAETRLLRIAKDGSCPEAELARDLGSSHSLRRVEGELLWLTDGPTGGVMRLAMP